MNGNELQALKRRLMDGDHKAQELAWKLHRADEPTKQQLLEDNQELIEQYPAPVVDEEEHPEFKI